MTTMNWLLDSDPAIRWQVMRDLTHEPAAAIAAERSRITAQGWGARLLDLQSSDGYWGDESERRTWMTTLYTLVTLKDLGVDPASNESRRALGRVCEHITWWQLEAGKIG